MRCLEDYAQVTTFVGFDLGEHFGYSVFTDFELVVCDTLKLPGAATKKVTVIARRYQGIKGLLATLREQHGEIDLVLYEQTDWHLPGFPGENNIKRLIREKQNRVVQRSLGRFEGMVEAACVEGGFTIVPVKVRDAKKALTGKPNAPKAAVRKSVLALFPSLKSAGQDALDSVSVAAWQLNRLDPLWRARVSVALKPKAKKD